MKLVGGDEVLEGAKTAGVVTTHDRGELILEEGLSKVDEFAS